jgi:hypothetical protein
MLATGRKRGCPATIMCCHSCCHGSPTSASKRDPGSRPMMKAEGRKEALLQRQEGRQVGDVRAPSVAALLAWSCRCVRGTVHATDPADREPQKKRWHTALLPLVGHATQDSRRLQPHARKCSSAPALLHPGGGVLQLVSRNIATPGQHLPVDLHAHARHARESQCGGQADQADALTDVEPEQLACSG